MDVRRLIAIAILGPALVATACSSGQGRDRAREQAYRANNRGVAFLEQFAYDDAAAAFRSALEIDGELGLAHVNLSIALLYAQDLAGARAAATDAARLLPDAPQPHYVLGLIARAENRTEDAAREFARVHAFDPADVGARVNLGQVYMEARRFDEAIALLRGAVDAEPYNVTAAYNLGLALTRAGSVDEGRAMLDRAQSLRGTGYGVTYGTGYLEQGRYAEAVASTGLEPDLVDDETPHVSFAVAPALSDGFGLPESPFGRTFTAQDLTTRNREIAAGLGGCLALVDADGDGDMDIVSATASGQRLLRNDGGSWTDATAGSGLEWSGSDVPVACLAGDVNGDAAPDILIVRYGRSSIYLGGERFSERTGGALPSYDALPGAAALVDLDHDGDLDIAVAGLADLAESRGRAVVQPISFPEAFSPAPVALWRNSGDGTFIDITAQAGAGARVHAVAIVPTDFDNRRDVDLLIVNATGPPVLYQNRRDGTFQDAAAETGLAAALSGGAGSVTAGDVNHDGFTDFFFGGPGTGVLALSDGRGRFTSASAPPVASASRAAHFIDYDLDGLLDLVAFDDAEPRVLRNLGTRWKDVTADARPDGPVAPPATARRLASADLNGDGRPDLAMGAGSTIVVWQNRADDPNQSLRVDLAGRISNRSAVGARVEVRAGSLRVHIERSTASPPAGPADVIVGLGDRPGADAVRVLWPSGILQAEAAEDPLPARLRIEELDRKPSSCPFLFVWNGERFEFVTDFLGAGEMGYWVAPGVRSTPDPVEYVRIAGDRLKARGGRYELRVTNELEEVLFLDRLQLLVVDHPAGIEIYPDEGMTGTPKPFRLLAVRDLYVPRVRDDQARDVTERIASIDRVYAEGFTSQRLRGYASTHSLGIDLAGHGSSPVLLLTGWTDYAFSSDNVAAHQAGMALVAPRLEVRSRRGEWRTVIDDLGVPVGRPQTVTADLTGRLRPGERELRIVTNMRIYWDRIAIGTLTPLPEQEVVSIDPSAAELRARGYSAEVRPDGLEPPTYDYDRTSRISPWKTMVGHYTREGDVRDLLEAADDMFVIARTGDEVAVEFDAGGAPPPRSGETRTFLLMARGYSKEMDINSATPDAVEPLPFRAMTQYPYAATEGYPSTPAHDAYRATYNTRVVSKPVSSIDSLLLEQ